MMTECGVCGKRIVIPYPEFYVYKREGVHFCSLDCMVVYKTQLTRQRCGFKTERTDKEMKQHKLTQEQKKQAVQIAIQGGDPLEYLKKSGAKNPSAAWWYIRKTLAEADPVTYSKLIDALVAHKPENEVEKGPEPRKAIVETTRQLPPEARTINEENAAEAAERAAEATLTAVCHIDDKTMNRVLGKKLEYKVIGIETKQGKFQYDHASDQMRWMPAGTTVVVMMQAEDWKKLAEDLPKIMKTIGADDVEDDEDGEE